MFNRNNFDLSKFISKWESRYELQAISVEPDATVATDGHKLIWMRAPEHGSVIENFPTIDGIKPTKKFKPFLLSKQIAYRLAKLLPKPCSATIPVLELAAVSIEEKGEGDAKEQVATLASTDLENYSIFRNRTIVGKFPNWRAVMPKKKPLLRVAVSPEYLRDIADQAKRLGAISIAVSVYEGEQEPVRFDAYNVNAGQGMTAILMPLRIGSTDAQRETLCYPEPNFAKQEADERARAAKENPPTAQPGAEKTEKLNAAEDDSFDTGQQRHNEEEHSQDQGKKEARKRRKHKPKIKRWQNR